MTVRAERNHSQLPRCLGGWGGKRRGKRGNETNGSNVDKKSVKQVMYIHQNPKGCCGSAEFCCDDTR